MTRYSGNGGPPQHIPESVFTEEASTEVLRGEKADCAEVAGGKEPPNTAPFGVLDGLLPNLMHQTFELEDYLLLCVLYLLYRESGDIEFLIIAVVMLFP